jgi:arylsulfatase A-like enzyme
MFERGEKEHSTPLLYEPIINIPLLISEPGQKIRRDVFAPTNAVDILPTIMHLAGRPIPAWCEGVLLPGLGGTEDTERSSFVVEAKNNPAFQPLKRATLVLRKNNYKLIYYTGYSSEDAFELYDLGADREEMDDIYPKQPAIARKMKEELLEALLAADKPYIK